MEHIIDHKKLKNLAISSNGFIFDPSAGHSYTSNEVGVLIIQKLGDGLLPSEIVEHICEEYDASESQVEQDVLLVIEQLKSYYLV